jgi:4-amino-4-deoxy-L-arabinose transferase-like glycosyltransferase
MPQAVYILFGALFAAAVSLALGKLLLQTLRLRLHRVEEEALAFVTGSAVLSLLVFVLATVHLARKGVYLALGAVIIAFAAKRGALRLAPERLPGIPRLYLALLSIAILVFGVVYLSNSMAPEKSPDGSGYHLGLVGRFARAYGFERITTNMYANLSLGLEMLFLFAYTFGKHSAAATLHLCFLFALLAMMVSYGRRFGIAQAGVASALFFFLSPVVGVDAISAYNDVALAAALFALFYVLQIWDAERNQKWAVIIGLLAGFAYAIKYTGFLAVPYAMGFVVWKLWRGRKPFWKPAAIIAACACLLILPWVVKNWIWVGNPFSPLFNRFFPNPYVHVSFEQGYSEYMRSYGVASKLAIPLEVTVRGKDLGGILGPLFLLSPIALFALRRQTGRRLLFVAGVFALTYPANIGTRFLIPALPFLCIALGLVLSRIPALAPLLIVAHGVLAWPPILNAYTEYVWRIEKVPHKAALRIEPEEKFLSERLDGYEAARLVEVMTPSGARIFAFSPTPEAYTTRDILIGFQSAFGEVIRDILLMPLIEDHQPVHHFELKFPAQQLRAIRVRQTNPQGTDVWSITELRVFAEGREIPRRSTWKPRSHPNPWDVEMALDLNPVTRWRSWQVLDSSMFFEIDFGEPVELDMVRVEASSGQWQAKIALDCLGEPGVWRSLGDFGDHIVVAPPDDLRLLAAKTARNRGIEYVLVYDYDFAAQDMRERTSEWGMTLAGERGPVKLYRLN